MEKYESGNCSICCEYFSLLHWHHTIPQSLGGANSLQIPLCSDCHNVLHANAVAMVAKIRNNTRIKRSFWRKPEMAERAQPYLAILVEAILNPPVTGDDKGYKLQVDVPGEIHRALKVLKQDIPGIRNLQEAALYCIVTTLRMRGLVNGPNQEEHREKGSHPVKRPASDLW